MLSRPFELVVEWLRDRSRHLISEPTWDHALHGPSSTAINGEIRPIYRTQIPSTAILSLLGPLKHGERNLLPRSSFNIAVACHASTLHPDAPTRYLTLPKGDPGIVAGRLRIMPYTAQPCYHHHLLDSDGGSPSKKAVGITSHKLQN